VIVQQCVAVSYRFIDYYYYRAHTYATFYQHLHTNLTHICRDISPSNIVEYQGKGYLLDYHVASSLHDCESRYSGITGKHLYRALSLTAADDNAQHSVATDLESLFYSILDMASDEKALKWRELVEPELIQNSKISCMTVPSIWSKDLLQRCEPEIQPQIERLYKLFSFGDGYFSPLKPVVTVKAFIAACQSSV
jgi:Fungal protein kinase